MLSVTFLNITLSASVRMLSVVLRVTVLCVVKVSVTVLSVAMLRVTALNIVMLSVKAFYLRM